MPLPKRLDVGWSRAEVETWLLTEEHVHPEVAALVVDQIDETRWARHWQGGLLTALFGVVLLIASGAAAALIYATAGTGLAFWLIYVLVALGGGQVLLGVRRMAKAREVD